MPGDPPSIVSQAIAIWKPLSILVTGALGVIGAFTVQRKSSGGLTRWGWISVLVILISAISGAAAQWIEQKGDAAKAIELSANIEHELTRVGPAPRIIFNLEFRCADPIWHSACAQIPEGPGLPADQVKNAPAALSQPLELSASFDNLQLDPHLSRAELARQFSTATYTGVWRRGSETNKMKLYRSGKTIYLELTGPMPIDSLIGRPVFFSNLDHYSLTIGSPNTILAGATPNTMTLVSDGGSAWIDRGKYQPLPPARKYLTVRDGFVAYRDFSIQDY